MLVDIVKVRLQAYSGKALDVTRKIWNVEGPRSFYKVSIQFGAFNFFSNQLENLKKQQRSNHEGSLTLGQVYLAGGLAGVTNSVISGPIEHIRIRLQTQPHGEKKLYSGVFDCVRKIWQQQGISGIYRGQVVTILREFHGYGVWFAAYEGLVQHVARTEGKNRSEIESWKFAVCGGLAGEFLWLLSHPLDVIKSKMQSDGFGRDQKYKTVREAVRQTWRMGGISGLFEGIGPALLRAMPVSAGTFATVEIVRKMLSGGNETLERIEI
ncbi:solute carrier family 25 member 46 [Fusarium pseudocircinatum]|uniref:Solute carrier family 25 member 46 n=1 Tax=Fusarium pseudocircinatum TaxID=56676 RepID=A0A8H5PJE1_9HYPO|nr:solute carrier family 25 member 46 [Fusarium pseudocircinatum]